MATEDEALGPDKSWSWNKGPVGSPEEDRKFCLPAGERSKKACHRPGPQEEKEPSVINWSPSLFLHSVGPELTLSIKCRSQDIDQNTNKFIPRQHGNIGEHQLQETKILKQPVEKEYLQKTNKL